MRRWIFLIAALLALPLHAQTALRGKSYAQELVDQVVARNPDLLVVVMHVTPPNDTINVVIASNIGRLGKVADDDDLKVIQTGQPQMKVSRDGQKYGVELAMRDVVGNTIGALGLVWPYAGGQDKAALDARANAIRDALARGTLTLGNLLDPFPFEPGATTKTRAQKLIDQAVARDPKVAVLALRGPAGRGGDLVVLGSTFGRHGKKADADDMKVLQATEPATGVYAGGKRFGVDLAFHDAAGATVGTMNVGYLLRAGDDTQALLNHALQLREDLQKRVTSADAMSELDP